jgi:hypothetical protein
VLQEGVGGGETEVGIEVERKLEAAKKGKALDEAHGPKYVQEQLA